MVLAQSTLEVLTGWLLEPLVFLFDSVVALLPLFYFVPVVLSLSLVLAASATIRSRRIRGLAVLGYLEQATRLNLPLDAVLAAGAASETGVLATRLRDVRAALGRGASVSEALRDQVPEVWPAQFWMLEGAEAMGRLGPTLTRIRSEGLGGLRNAGSFSSLTLAYAATLAGGLLLMFGFFQWMIWNKYLDIFFDFDIETPAPTAWLMSMSEDLGVAVPLLAGLGLAVAMVVGCIGVIRYGGRSRRMGAVASRLGGLAEGVIPGLKTLAGHRTWSHVFALGGEAVAADRLDAGETGRTAFSGSGLPRLARGLLPLTPTGGRSLVETFGFLSVYHQNRLVTGRVWLRSVVVPLAYGLVAVAIAWFALALFLPLVRLIQSVTPDWSVL